MNLEKLSVKAKILIIIVVLLSAFFILDFNYFLGNFEFLFHKDAPINRTIQPAAVAQLPKIQPNTLIISSLDINAPIIYATATNETAYQAALINGVVHYPGTANPGEPGNCYIFGHSSDYIWSKGHYKHVFAVLPKIQIATEINISGPNGDEFTYLVTDSHEVAANDLSVLSQQGYSKKLLTLQTSYPVGTALARWVVIAELKNP